MKVKLKHSQNRPDRSGGPDLDQAGDQSQNQGRAGRLFPFSAVIGQEDLKLSLILNAVNPGIGGVLIRGEKGTAKSTIVRALADLLPKITVRQGCGFNCSPDDPVQCPACRESNGTETLLTRRKKVITLPLNATEDRVAGGLDFEQALKQGMRVMQPGLLARAHQGILYVDEINLLDDHIVDIILDASASGENRVEREGISLSHASQFLLVGTMNPEEGDLRPQLLDRFGFCVEVTAETDPEQRVELMVQRDVFDLDPQGFREAHEADTRELSLRIEKATERLPGVRMPKHLRTFIAELCASHHVAGHRADLTIEQGAVAHAALKGRNEVTVEDIQAVSLFALLHRKQEESDPPPPPPEHQDPEDQEPPENEEDEEKEEEQDESPDEEAKELPPEEQDQSQEEAQPEGQDDREMPPPPPEDKDDDSVETLFEIGEPFKVKKIESYKDRTLRRGSGRRSRTRVSQKQGRYVKSTMNRGRKDIAFDATLRAAAPFQKDRTVPEGLCVALTPADVREKIREKKMGNFLLFVVDASGSMGAKGRMTASKGAILSLLLDAYQKRDKVAMVSFRKTEALVNLPVTSSIELAAQHLAEMPVGGRTPLSAGLDKAYGMIKSVQYRDLASRPIVIIITDGKSNLALGDGKPVEEAMMMAARMGEDERVTYIVVDTEVQGPVMFGLARDLAAAANARYYKIDDLKSDTLVDLVKENQ